MTFSFHINHLVKQCFVLCHLILKSFYTKNPLLSASVYKSYVLPSITYGVPFFYPHSVETINQLEKIQRKFTKILLIKRNLDYISRLAILDLQLIELLFIKLGLKLIYKSLHSSSPITRLLPPLLSSSTRNSQIRFQVTTCKTNLRKNLFPTNLIIIWNSMPNNVLTSSSLQHFSKCIDHLDLSRFLKGRASKAS